MEYSKPSLYTWLDFLTQGLGPQKRYRVILEDKFHASDVPESENISSASELAFGVQEGESGYDRIILVLDSDAVNKKEIVNSSMSLLRRDGDAVIVVGRAVGSFRRAYIDLIRAIPALIRRRASGLENLLEGTDFKSKNSYVFLPSILEPSILADANNIHAMRTALSCVFGGLSLYFWYGLLILLKFRSYLSSSSLENLLSSASPACCIYVSRSGQQSIFSECNRELSRCVDRQVSFSAGVCTTEKILLLAGGRTRRTSHVLKWPLQRRKTERRSNPFSDSITLYNTFARTCTIEEWRRGSRIKTRTDKDAIEVLMSLQARQEPLRRKHASAEYLQRYVKDARDHVNMLSLEGVERDFAFRAIHQFSSSLSRPIHECVEHGDFVASNLLITRQREVVILDSENWVFDGLDIFDPICFYLSILAGEPKHSSPRHFASNLVAKQYRRIPTAISQDWSRVARADWVPLTIACLCRKLSITAKENRQPVYDYWSEISGLFIRHTSQAESSR